MTLYASTRHSSFATTDSEGSSVSPTSSCCSPLLPNERDVNLREPGSFVKVSPKVRITCHRCGNIRKTNITCDNCEQIFCKACARKFEEYSDTGFSFGEKSSVNGCPVCLKLCCCGNPKGYECKSKLHCYRRCETSRKSSKRRAKAADTAVPATTKRVKANVISKLQVETRLDRLDYGDEEITSFDPMSNPGYFSVERLPEQKFDIKEFYKYTAAETPQEHVPCANLDILAAAAATVLF